MTEPSTSDGSSINSFEPCDRLVVLARTFNTNDEDRDALETDVLTDDRRFGETYLGQSLYRHQSIFQNASDAPVWSHFELTYFRGYVPNEVLHGLVFSRSRNDLDLLRAEILVTTPGSFHLPRTWKGMEPGSARVASLEFLHVQPQFLEAYRDAMQDYCGPAAARLVSSGRFGTFRAMETAAILYQSPDFDIDWNQVHLCELDPDGFESFGSEFRAAMQSDLPEGAEFIDSFANLGRLRTILRWTFNEAVVERDLALTKSAK